MIKTTGRAVFAATLIAAAASAHASLIGGKLDKTESAVVDLGFGYRSLTAELDPIDFNIGANKTLVDITVTFDPFKGSKGSVASNNIDLDKIGRSGSITNDGFTVQTLKNGDVVYTYVEQLNKGSYSVGDLFTLKNGWKGDVTFNVSGGSVSPVPEPSTYALMGLGVLGLVMVRRRGSRPAIGNIA